jgi:hypothetical protein
MNDLHALGVTEEFRSKIEGVDPRFIKDGILFARERSWEVFHAIQKEIKIGMNEVQARELAKNIFLAFGVKKHWHQPSIRFGDGTIQTFHRPLNSENILADHSLVFMDLGPVWFHPETQMEYEGDVGDSFVIGENAEAELCVQTVRLLFAEGKAKWLREQCSGVELYRYLEERAQALGYRTVPDVTGHRLGDFPHQKYSKQDLPGVGFTPSAHLWILELQIAHPTLPIGAFYEDLLF